MGKKGKKFTEALGKVDRVKHYSLDEAVALLKEVAFAKFNETIELSAKLSLKKGHSVRDTVVLPHQFGAQKRILVFAKGDKAEEAKEAGAAYVGDADLIEKIKGGWLDFDLCIATPDMMKDVGKLGPILGRRGMMPNPKTQTVTMDVKGAISEMQKGRREFRADKTGVVNLAVGKVQMDEKAIKENIEAFMSELKKKKPSDVKGDFIKTVSIASTMGPGIRLEFV